MVRETMTETEGAYGQGAADAITGRPVNWFAIDWHPVSWGAAYFAGYRAGGGQVEYPASDRGMGS
jgi:hypothetical protein